MEFVDKIDEIDRKILQIITQNARKPFKDVAEAVGISRAAVHQRVQKMFDNGIITGSGLYREHCICNISARPCRRVCGCLQHPPQKHGKGKSAYRQ